MSSRLIVDGVVVAWGHDLPEKPPPQWRGALPEQLQYALGEREWEQGWESERWRRQRLSEALVHRSVRTMLWAVQLAPHAKTHAGLQQSCDMDDAIFVLRVQDKLTYRKISGLVGMSQERCRARYERRLRTVYRFLAIFGKDQPLFPLVSVTKEEANHILVFTDMLLEGQVLP